jgi:hypothetical protein
VKALIAALECAGRIGIGGGLEQSTILRTTFVPGRRKSAFGGQKIRPSI